MRTKIIEQCKKILSEHFVDSSKFKFRIEQDNYGRWYVIAFIGKKLYYEISDIYVDGEGKIIQYCVSWH